MGSLNLDYFIHAANILLLGAYSVRDILWLRLLAVASSLSAIPYFLLQPTPLWAAFGWSVLFTGINIFQAWRLLVERRPVKLTPEEEEVRGLVFRDLPPRKVLQVLSIGSWVTAARGERLIEHGKPVESVSLIVRGKVQMTTGGHVLGELGVGEIVGSALLLSGAPADWMRWRWRPRAPSDGKPGRWSVISTPIRRPETCSNGILPRTWPGRCAVWPQTSPRRKTDFG